MAAVMRKTKLLQVVTVLIISISNAHSKGSPWDWQSMNAKYPSDHSRSNLPAYGSTKPFPEIMPVNANVSVFESHTALLPCRIKQLQEYTVSWLRGRDTTVLSVGVQTFSSDPRFRVMRVVGQGDDDTSDWSLEINAVHSKDEGWYDCQVNTEPKINFKSYLKVLPSPPPRKLSPEFFPSAASSDRSLQDAPSSETRPPVIPQIQEFLQSLNPVEINIAGPSMLWKKQGEILDLRCTIKHRDNISPIALWAHDGRVIQDGDGGHPDSDRNVCVEVESPLPGNTRGRLKIHGLRVEDSGTYSCLDKEGAVQPDSIRVVVVDDEVSEQQEPVVMAQLPSPPTKEVILGEDPIESEVAAVSAAAFQFRKFESRLALLESQVNSLLRKCQTQIEPKGAETLASRDSSSTISAQTSTMVTVSTLMSLLLGWISH